MTDKVKQMWDKKIAILHEYTTISLNAFEHLLLNECLFFTCYI